MKINFEQAIEIKAAKDGPATFHAVAYAGNPMRPGGWPKPEPVILDIAAMQVPEDAIPVNADHSQELRGQIGHGIASRMKDRIDVNGVFSVPGQATETIVTAAQQGRPWKASVEATISGAKLTPKGKSTSVNGQVVQGPVYVAASTLHGLAIVSKGADSGTSVNVFAEEDNEMSDNKEAVENAEVTAATETETNETEVAAVDQAFAGVDVQAAANAAAKAATEAAQKEVMEMQAHFAMVDKHCGRDFFEIAAKAKDERWPEAEVKLAVYEAKDQRLAEIRASRGTGPAIHSESSEDVTSDVYAAHISKSFGVSEELLVSEYGEKTMELTAKLPKSPLSLSYVIFAALRNAGHYYPAGTKIDPSIWAQAIRNEQRIQLDRPLEVAGAAAFSSISFSDILSNVMHKRLLAIRQGWPTIVDSLFPRVVHDDFREWESYQMYGDLEPEELAPSGEITHGTLSDQKYTNQIKMYARMLSINFQDLTNDSLGAFDRRATLMGQAAMRGREKRALQTIYNAGVGTFYLTSGNTTNRLTASPLSASTLSTALTTLKQMKDPNGDPISQMPGVLLTPVALSETANNLVSRTTVVIENSSSTVPAGNLEVADQFLGRARPVESPYLDTDSATTWYLLADPTMSDDNAFEYAVFDQTDQPRVETQATDFNTIGLQTRIWWAYGFATQSPAGVVRVEAT